MWWKNADKTSSIPVELNFREIVYFRLIHFMCPETIDDLSRRTHQGPRALGSYPHMLDYPGKLSLWRRH